MSLSSTDNGLLAGISKTKTLNEVPDYDAIDSTIATNSTAPLHLTAALRVKNLLPRRGAVEVTRA